MTVLATKAPKTLRTKGKLKSGGTWEILTLVFRSWSSGLGLQVLAFRLLSRLPRLQASKEVDHGGADFRRTFLLGPMSATRQHDRRPKFWDQGRLLRDVLRIHGGDKIAVTRHVKRGNAHRRTSEGSQ